VNITKILHKAYSNACEENDFITVAGRLGMLLSIDGTGDGHISLEGFGHVNFTDGDCSPISDTEDAESDSDVDEAGAGGDDDAEAASDDEFVRRAAEF